MKAHRTFSRALEILLAVPCMQTMKGSHGPGYVPGTAESTLHEYMRIYMHCRIFIIITLVLCTAVFPQLQRYARQHRRRRRSAHCIGRSCSAVVLGNNGVLAVILRYGQHTYSSAVPRRRAGDCLPRVWCLKSVLPIASERKLHSRFMRSRLCVTVRHTVMWECSPHRVYFFCRKKIHLICLFVDAAFCYYHPLHGATANQSNNRAPHHRLFPNRVRTV